MIPIYIQCFSTISALGNSDGLRDAIFSDSRSGVQHHKGLFHQETPYGLVPSESILDLSTIYQRFPNLSQQRLNRTTQLTATALCEILPEIESVKKQVGNHRIGIVLGSSTGGMLETEKYFTDGENDPHYDDTTLEVYSPVKFIAEALGITGPVFAISTACSSSAKALASAARMIRSGLADAVIAGGIDGMTGFTVAGFSALGATSQDITLPFSSNRNGINLGEGGALFLLSTTPSDIELAGYGETSDAYHISSPDPSAAQVIRAMQQALEMAGEKTVDYINAHGTGTVHNDSMESVAISSVLGTNVPTSSTKPITGHTLGGAGALEAAVSCMAIQEQRLPTHFSDNLFDRNIPAISLVNQSISARIRCVLSNSFAFGGNNAVLLFRQVKENA